MATCKMILPFESVDETFWSNHLLCIIFNENMTRKEDLMMLLFLLIFQGGICSCLLFHCGLYIITGI